MDTLAARPDLSRHTDRRLACAGCGARGEGARCAGCGAARRAGSYRIEALVATTPHSRVYRAVGADGQVVALKELAFIHAPPEERVRAFYREAELLRQLKHPQIPRYVRAFEEGEGVARRLYLAQEFIEGPSLLEELETRRFTEAEALEVARQVLGVLVYLQGLSPSVVHRDLKPANLLRRPDGRVAVVDFGAARDGVLGTYGGTMAVGTAAYMPPEQLAGEVDDTSDLYALGATLYHLLARRPPRPSFEARRHPPAVGLAIAPGARAFINRLMAVRPGQRFSGAAAALAALEGGLTAPTPPREARLRLRPLLLTAGLLLAPPALLTALMVLPPTSRWIAYLLDDDGFLATGRWELPDDTLEQMAYPPEEDADAGAVLSGEAALQAMQEFLDDRRQLTGAPFSGPQDSEAILERVAQLEARLQQTRVDAWSLTAADNLRALAEAEEAYRAATGDYLLFEEGDEATWAALELRFPEAVHHRFSASLKGGELLLVAEGNLDEDPFTDLWWGGPANGFEAQLTSDALNLDMYPDDH